MRRRISAEEIHNIAQARKYEKEVAHAQRRAEHLKEKEDRKEHNKAERERVRIIRDARLALLPAAERRDYLDRLKANDPTLVIPPNEIPQLMTIPDEPPKPPIADPTLAEIEASMLLVDDAAIELEENAKHEHRLWDWKTLPPENNSVPALTMLQNHPEAPPWSWDGVTVDEDGDPVIQHTGEIYTIWVEGKMVGWQCHEPHVAGHVHMDAETANVIAAEHVKDRVNDRVNQRIIQQIVGADE